MQKFPFLRRPVRLILYAILLALVTTAALIFAWQYKLDGIILDHAIDTYAYVGTIVRSDGEILDSILDRDLVSMTGDDPPEMGGPAFLEEIPEPLVQRLYGSEYVARIDSRETLAALVGDYTRVQAEDTAQTAKVPDLLMTVSSREYYFLEGTIKLATIWPMDDPDLALDTYQIQVDKMWSDPDFDEPKMSLDYWRHPSDSPLQEGQRVFLMGEYIYSGTSGLPLESQTIVHSTKYLQMRRGPEYELSLTEQNPYLIIPDGVESDAYIREFLESTGLDSYLERQMRTQHTVSVRKTQDMTMIPIFAQGKAKTYEGRTLTPADVGKKVCVISSSLSSRNRLSVGDIIRLSIAEGCYITQPSTSEISWESGDPSEDDTLLEYGAYEEYEIVGIYSERGRRGNYLDYNFNDIFLPADPGTRAQIVRPYAFSFRVPGPDYEAFLTAFQPILDEYGYSLIVEDTGWDDVKESFYTMQTRRQLMLLCAAAAFAAAVLVIAVLLSAHCRYEYGLRRLLGASRREAVGIYGGVFLFTAIPGAIIAVTTAWFAAVRLLRGSIATDPTLPLPTDSQCAAALGLWAAAELAAVALVLLCLAWRNERRGLLRLVRR